MKVSRLFIAILLLSPAATAELPVVTVGSKSFTESYILAEIVSEIIESAGEATVDRRFGMGATGILYTAVNSGAIDLYPEYSGTLSEAILKDPAIRNLDQIREALNRADLTISESLGFNNTYAIGLRQETAGQEGLRTISDLARAPDLRFGFSYEFMNRPDGFPALIRAYDLHPRNVSVMDHSVAYEALAQGRIDGTDVYSTDAKIEKLKLAVLADDKAFFPKYEAVLLTRMDFVRKFPRSWKALKERLGHKITENRMRQMNAEADLGKKGFRQIAEGFLGSTQQKAGRISPSAPFGPELVLRTRQHLMLVAISLGASIISGIPLGILASRHQLLGQFILGASGILQTIPSLALLCFLIPVFGVGNPPALVALFLYALLPIVSNTYLGLTGIDRAMLDSARALGLSPSEKLRRIELPLASPSILTGVRTSAVISIGTATLAALIGAGGYGVPIITGLALNDIPTVLTGAVPAAFLALLTHGFFDQVSKMIIPEGILKQ